MEGAVSGSGLALRFPQGKHGGLPMTLASSCSSCWGSGVRRELSWGRARAGCCGEGGQYLRWVPLCLSHPSALLWPQLGGLVLPGPLGWVCACTATCPSQNSLCIWDFSLFSLFQEQAKMCLLASFKTPLYSPGKIIIQRAESISTRFGVRGRFASGSGCQGPSCAWVMRLCCGPRGGGWVEGPFSSTPTSIWGFPYSTRG